MNFVENQKTESDILSSKTLHCECCSSKTNLNSIFEECFTNNIGEIYADMITYCFSIEIPYGNHKKICITCIEQLQKSYAFKSAILQTQKDLVLINQTLDISDNPDSEQNQDGDEEPVHCTGTIKSPLYINEDIAQDKRKAKDKKLKKNPNKGANKNQNKGRNLPYKIDRNSLSCQICNVQFKQFKELQNHMPTHFPKYICHVCGRLFPNEFHLKIHQKCHRSHDLKCQHCDRMFKTRGTLQQHVSVIHLGVKKKYNCFSCEDSFSTHYMRLKHTIEQHGAEGKKFKCNTCPRQFHLANHLQEHVRKQHLNVRPFECDKCSYKGYTNWALKQHYVTHTGDKRFHCDVCFKSYGRRNTLQEHMKMHKGDS